MQVKKLNVFYLILVLVFKLHYIFCVKTIECGYKQCPQTRDGALNVHLIPHSHMDAGWVKTFDQYYFGTKTSTSTANVQLIYHSVLSELLHDKRRKFTFSETAYFWRWWKEQRGAMRATFRTLVQEGRVEFAGGGWVHNDEATPDYLQIIDQYTWGLRKLNDTLGPCGKPKAAWQIDSYGHTREQVSLLAQMGFDGLFIGRVDHKERDLMIDEDRMEFMWRGSDTLGKMSDIMTNTLFNLYNAPEGFCFDFLCNDEPIVDDTDSRVYNAEQRVNEFILQVEKQAKYYDHDNIMVTMGGDFTYQSASNWFMNMDKLINHVNTHPANLSDINIFYSTPSCYLKAIYLYGRRDKAIFTEKGDHMPYGSDAMTYWTGYYSSRPALKYLARKAHMFLQMMKQLTVISRLSDSYELHLLRHAVSLVLHHDAITGTSQQHVSNDFTRILSEALESSSKKVSSLLSYLTPTWGGSRRSKNNQQFVICHQLNMSQCHFTETQDTLLVLVYNPLSVKTYYHVRFPTVPLHYSIRDYNDEEVEYQLVPLPAAVINLPGRTSSAIQEICFEAENIPPLGFTSYHISPVREQGDDHQFSKRDTKPIKEEQETIAYISNEYIKVTVDKSTGLLESVQLVDGTKIAVSQNFYFYAQSQQSLQSGAYSFRPQQERPVAVTDKVTYHTIRGNIVKEIRQRFNDWITQIIRLYRGEEYVELEYIIGPVPIGTDLGKEVVTILSTNISSSGQFFTDSNARQMMRRTCWNETNMSEPHKKPIASCYYPVTSRLCIYSMNSSVEMCVLPDRTQGGTSYNDGEVELMVHRRLLTDDGFGLEEALNEEAYGVGLVIRGKHRLKFGNYKQEIEDLSFSERVSQSARRWQYEPWVFFSSGQKLSRRKWQNVRNKRFSALRVRGLPRHVHILTLEPWKGGSILLRLENTLEHTIREQYKTQKPDQQDEITNKAAHVAVDLKKLFLQLSIKSVRETTLAANQWLDDARQMDWSTRYVYNGADDGLLPEDVEEAEDRHGTSDEDQEDSRRKYNPYTKPETNKNKLRTQHQNYEKRKKRDVNTTKNDLENLINDTSNDNEIKYSNHTTFLETTTLFTTMYTPRSIITNSYNNITLTKKVGHTTQKTPRLSFLNRLKTKVMAADWMEDSVEIMSSEEDFSANLKKRSSKNKNPRIKKSKQEEEIIYDTDDGITKSIYEMYYKPKNYHQTSERTTGEEFRKKNKKQTTVDDYDDSKKIKRVKNVRDKLSVVDRLWRVEREDNDNVEDLKREKENPYGKNKDTILLKSPQTKKVYDEVTPQDYYDEEDYIPYSQNHRRREENRRKRALNKEETQDSNASEPAEDSEYVITLRPTQIRTFVIWYETNRKSQRID